MINIEITGHGGEGSLESMKTIILSLLENNTTEQIIVLDYIQEISSIDDFFKDFKKYDKIDDIINSNEKLILLKSNPFNKENIVSKLYETQTSNVDCNRKKYLIWKTVKNN